MAFVGWYLGPSLGNTVSHLLYSAPWPTYHTPEYQTWYSLFMVWETTLGLFLGLVLGRLQGAAQEREVQP